MVVIQIFFIFTPNLGEDSQFDEHIFQLGWFNHQLDKDPVLKQPGFNGKSPRFFLNVAHLSSDQCDHVTPGLVQLVHSSHGKSGVSYSRTERVAALRNNSKNTVVLLLYIYRGFDCTAQFYDYYNKPL